MEKNYEASTLKLRDLGLTPRNWTNQVVVAEALNRGLEVSKNDRNYIVLQSSDGRRFTWKSGFTNFNTVLAQRVANYKDVYSRLLADYGAPATENAVFQKGEAARAWLWAESLGTLVVKPLDGIHGRNVFVGINNRDEFAKVFDIVANSSDGRVLVEKFYSGTEHRCYMVNHKLIAVTRRRPASILGDGMSTVRELVDLKNSKDRGYPNNRVHSKLELGEEAKTLLAEKGYNFDSVVPKTERTFIRTTSNIHAGGDAIDATDELSEDEVEAIELASRAVPGGRVVGLDVLLPRDPGDSGVHVLEMNTNAMISMHHFPWEGKARDAAGAVIDAMFPSTKTTAR